MQLIKRRSVVFLLIFLLTPSEEQASTVNSSNYSNRRSRRAAPSSNILPQSSNQANITNPYQPGFFSPTNTYNAYPPYIPPGVMNVSHQVPNAMPSFQSHGLLNSSVQFPTVAQIVPNFDYAAFHQAMYPRGITSTRDAFPHLSPAPISSTEYTTNFTNGNQVRDSGATLHMSNSHIQSITHSVLPTTPGPHNTEVLPQIPSTSTASSSRALSNLSLQTVTMDPDEIRRERARLQKQRSRKNETPAAKKKRLDRDAAARANARATETEEETRARQNQDAIAHRESKAHETEDERRVRQLQNATAHRESRTHETEDERRVRQMEDASAHRDARANETEGDRRARQTQDASAHRVSYADRAQDHAREIQERNTENHRRRRQDITPAQRDQVNAQRRNNYQRRREEQRNRTLLIAEHGYGNPPYHLGPMHSECVLCGALYFAGEGVETNGGTYDKCCNHGSFDLMYFRDYPQELMALLKKDHNQSSNFHANIRQFNNALAMASMDAQINSPPGRGPFVFRVHGQIHHNIGPALSGNGNNLGYGSFYFIDTQQAADERMGRRPNSSCNPSLMRSLSVLMARENALARSYKMMGDVYREEEANASATNSPLPTMKMVFYHDRTKDQRRYNAPITNEVAGIFVGPEGEVPTPREYTVCLRNGSFNKLTVKNPLLDPMAYPIFWPTGQTSWHPELWKYPTPGGIRKRITQSEFYSYLLSIRRSFNPLHYAGKLFQQFVVDVWLRMEQNKLEWARHNQSKLRADLYQNLEEFVDSGNGGLAGTRVLLPSTHIGSPRNYAQEYQDTMTMVSKFGKPDYFLTFTCNPKWKEITENLLSGQDASDRPDLVSRVFNMKWKELLKDINERRIFGEVVAYAYTIEWQKRGLPHAHLLITVSNRHKPDTPEKVDNVRYGVSPAPSALTPHQNRRFQSCHLLGPPLDVMRGAASASCHGQAH